MRRQEREKMRIVRVLSFRLPVRFLRGQYLRTLLTVIALALGVALICALDLVTRSMQLAFEEVIDTMSDLREVQCDILTIGQYLQPTKSHLPVERYVHPDEFAKLKRTGLEMGFRYVESGPLVRSSYHAAGQV